MVSISSNVKRDNSMSTKQDNNYNNETPGFTHILKKAVDDKQPTDCYTVTYNAKSELQSFYYAQRREYTIYN